jgi:surfeit locus 1 family protein
MARFNFVFKPTLIPTIAFLVVFPVLLMLGNWQLNRADEKRGIEQGVAEAVAKPPLLVNESNLDALKDEIYRPAKLKGRFDNSRQYLWDNKTNKGRSGYQVLTPFLLDGLEQVVIVNRGWIPILGRRDEFQDITVAEDVTSIEGVIKTPSNAIQLAERVEQDKITYPSVIQAFEPSVIAAQLEVAILPIMIELSPEAKQGYVREWQPYFGKIGKHMGYAVQWFIMAFIALFLYIKLNTKRRQIEAS